MLSTLKRYSMALFFLVLVVFLMIIGTLGVKSFGDKMFEDSGIKMQPRGEKIN
jgi:amino acid permease